MFWFFDCEACEIFLAPWPGIEPAPPALEGRVSTTGLPGESHSLLSDPQQSKTPSDMTLSPCLLELLFSYPLILGWER